MKAFSLVVLSCATVVSNAAVILPMGDSITVGQYGAGFTPGAWRSRLEALDPSVSFVGPTTTNPAPGQISTAHCSFSGITSDWPQPRVGFWGPYLAVADTVTFWYGVNDLQFGRGVAGTTASIEISVRLMLSVKPSVRFLICTIPPRKNGSGQTEIDQTNVALAELVAQLRKEGYDAMLAPVHRCFDPVTSMMIDNLHPNAACYDRIAAILNDARTELPGDVDGDGDVSIYDYIRLSDAFDSMPGDANWNWGADLDRDDVVSIYDYIELSDNFDRTKFEAF